MVHVKAYANSMSMGVSVRNAVKVSRIDTSHDCLVGRGNKGQGQWQVAISNKCPSNRVVNMRCSSSVTQGCGFANPNCRTLRARRRSRQRFCKGASIDVPKLPWRGNACMVCKPATLLLLTRTILGACARMSGWVMSTL